MRPAAALVAVTVLLGGCRPATIAEAERKGDVAWLDENGTPDAVAALGRLADARPAAVAALETRSSWDGQAFKAAWSAFARGASWGATLMHAGLADPARADLAASAVEKGDARLSVFVGDLESALQRLSATLKNFNVSSALASVGPPAHDAIARRLADASTRGAMCRGIAAPAASADARKTLTAVPVASRDAAPCVDAVVQLAASDEATLSWLGDQGEPGLLGAAGKSEALSCAKLHGLWARALASRPRDVASALVVPLGYAVRRCARDMDGVLADALAHQPASHAMVVEAIDPFNGYGESLRATCVALGAVASGPDPALVRERASDALLHACRTGG